MTYKKVKMESGGPFNSMDWLVAMDEGLFEKEGLDVEFVKHGIPKATDVSLINAWNQVSSSKGGHAEAVERNAANFMNACEWGNYRRSQDSSVGARQLARRACVTWGGIAVPPWSDVYTPQQLADKTIAVSFHSGTHYLTLQLLEGFVPREMVKLVSSGRPGIRYRSMMNGEVDACSVREPWSSVALKDGCRIIAQGFYTGTDIATDEIDTDTYAAINRALSEAVRRLNADKKKYAQYFIDRAEGEEVERLSVEDIDLNHLVYIQPGQPIPEEELQKTYDWMVSWDLIGGGLGADDLVNTKVAALADD